MINGRGTLLYADGDRYDGEWVQGKMHGAGEPQADAHDLPQVCTPMLMEISTMENGWTIRGTVGSRAASVQPLTWNAGHGTVTYVGENGNNGDKYDGQWVAGSDDQRWLQ